LEPTLVVGDDLAGGAIDRLLHELATNLDLDELARENRRAIFQAEKLLAAPSTWNTAGADPFYRSPAVVWHLLHASLSETHPNALRLIDLAEEIALRLCSTQPLSTPMRQLPVEVRCARAERLIDVGNTRQAERELRSAARLLASDLGYAKALYCRTLGGLRRAECSWDESLALLERSAALFYEFGCCLESTQVQLERAWVSLEADQPEEAVPYFIMALQVEDIGLPLAILARLGLAVALAAIGDSATAAAALGGNSEKEGSFVSVGNLPKAKRLLIEADTLTAHYDEPAIRLRMQWLAGQTAGRLGQPHSAMRRLCRVVGGLVQSGDAQKGSLAFLHLLTFCHERGFRYLPQLRSIRETLATLSLSPELTSRGRRVLHFATSIFQDQPASAGEVLRNARAYLLQSQYHPTLLPFLPTQDAFLAHLDWELLESSLRRTICAEVGVDETFADAPSGDLDPEIKDHIAWHYELRRRLRIIFADDSRRGI
jgi:hypothetical protein